MGGKNSVPAHRPSVQQGAAVANSTRAANEESVMKSAREVSGSAATAFHVVSSESKDKMQPGRSFHLERKTRNYTNASSITTMWDLDSDIVDFRRSISSQPAVQKLESLNPQRLSLLDDIEDDYPVYKPRDFAASPMIPPPAQSPLKEEPAMPEFLSRSSWSNFTNVQQQDVQAQSFAPLSQQQSSSERAVARRPYIGGAAAAAAGISRGPYQHCMSSLDESTLERAAFSFASQMEMGNLVPPSSYRRSTFHKVRLPHSGISLGSWIKDRKKRKKEATRCQNAEVHAAIAIAGLAAGIAAVTAATAASATDEASTRTSIAVASAAALVAAQCVEVAERMGADRDHMAAVVSSAVNVRSAGDIMTLRASAATSLRGAATLRARRVKEVRSLASVTPYERVSSCDSSAATVDEAAESEAENSCQELLARGTEFLKRGKNGDLHWRTVSVYINNKLGKVLVQLQSKHMKGVLTLNQKSVVLQVYPNIPAWPGRNLLENGEHRSYFALKTSRGTMEFECQKEEDHQLWTESISFLLYISSQRLLK